VKKSHKKPPTKVTGWPELGLFPATDMTRKFIGNRWPIFNCKSNGRYCKLEIQTTYVSPPLASTDSVEAGYVQSPVVIRGDWMAVTVMAVVFINKILPLSAGLVPGTPNLSLRLRLGIYRWQPFHWVSVEHGPRRKKHLWSQKEHV